MKDLVTKDDLDKALDNLSLKITMIAGFQLAIFILTLLLILNGLD